MKRSIRFNPDQERVHQDLIKILGIERTHGADATAVHIAEQVTAQVIQNLFGANFAEVLRRAVMQAMSEKKLGRPKKPAVVPHPLTASVGQNQKNDQS